MIRIKLTSSGGYVLGDGDCPFDPDQFMKLFAHKVIAAKMQGLSEIGFTDEEIELAIAAEDAQFGIELDNATVHVVEDTTPMQLLLEG
jgi:hypothetical protein